jgi:N-acetylglucosamine-6-phosphate deacetylase
MARGSETVVRAATVLTATGPLSPGEVVLDQGSIVRVGPTTGAVDHQILAPGFVDLQMNGIGAVDVASASGTDWETLDAALLAQGVTTWCPTLCTAPRPEMEASLDRIREAAGRGGTRPAIAGAHLEGPFLAVAGAHNPAYMQGEVDTRWLLSLVPGVALVTLAPELSGALEAIEALVATGVLVALGHSACRFEDAEWAAGNGARLVTHLGNAMGRFGHREPGLLGAALTDDRLAVSLIADLVHVHPALVRMSFRAKGAGRTVLVTDAVATNGSERSGSERSGSERSGSGGDEPPRQPDGTLVGSVLHLDRAVANTVEAAGISLSDAVAAASTTPAGLLGLSDRGAIEPGRRGDLVALDSDLRAETVWVGGRVAWSGATGP